jgi:hypothetical protein
MKENCANTWILGFNLEDVEFATTPQDYPHLILQH